MDETNIQTSASGRLVHLSSRANQYHDVHRPVSGGDLPPMIAAFIAEHAGEVGAAKMQGVSKQWQTGAQFVVQERAQTAPSLQGQRAIAQARQEHQTILATVGWVGLKKDRDIRDYAIQAAQEPQTLSISQRISRAAGVATPPEFSTADLAKDNAKLAAMMSSDALSGAEKTAKLQATQKYRHLERAKLKYLQDPGFIGLQKALLTDVKNAQRSL